MTSVTDSKALSEIKIIHEDEDWLVINKPAGIACQGGSLRIPIIVDVLKTQAGRYQTGFLAPAHRLDTNVSGVLVLAKNAKAADFFRRQLQSGQVRKEYVALVTSSDDKILPQSLLHQGLKRDKKLVCYSYFEKFTGPTQSCRLTILQSMTYKKVTQLTVQLLTGVFHQIRSQFASAGMPIIGDAKYGSLESANQILLHASKTNFCLKSSSQLSCFAAELPQEMILWLQK
jgi:23S rRNA-/tRNA-specific pseudouridylate synthase